MKLETVEAGENRLKLHHRFLPMPPELVTDGAHLFEQRGPGEKGKKKKSFF